MGVATTGRKGQHRQCAEAQQRRAGLPNSCSRCSDGGDSASDEPRWNAQDVEVEVAAPVRWWRRKSVGQDRQGMRPKMGDARLIGMQQSWSWEESWAFF